MDQSDYNRFVAGRFNHDARRVVSLPLFIACAGLMGEAGEVVDAVKKIERDGLSPTTKQKLIDELGDQLFYFTTICRLYNISFDRIREDNVKKLVGRDRDRNLKEASENEAARESVPGRKAAARPGKRVLDH